MKVLFDCIVKIYYIFDVFVGQKIGDSHKISPIDEKFLKKSSNVFQRPPWLSFFKNLGIFDKFLNNYWWSGININFLTGYFVEFVLRMPIWVHFEEHFVRFFSFFSGGFTLKLAK